MQSENQQLITRITAAPHIAIYGAQVVAYGAYTALRSLYSLTPACFLVTNLSGNPAAIDGVEVRTLDNCNLDPASTLVLIAVTELLQDEIAHTLQNRGFRNILRIGAHEEHLLMSAYFDSIGRFALLEPAQNVTASSIDFAVFEAKNHRDNPLKNPPPLGDWEHSIQAGAALVLDRIAPLTDDTGDNISSKNRMYSEMTATYWVWKNTSHNWKGICHYRRHFVLSAEQIGALSDSSIDALLPLPYICYPDTLSQFRRFVSEDVKSVLLQVLRELHPSEFDCYLKILQGKYQYTYNLVCAKAEVFGKYCDWIFTILHGMERYADSVPEIATTRALSYAAEVLTSLYFLSNHDKLSIRHVEKAIFT